MQIFGFMMVIFIVFIFLGVPVSFSIGIATIVAVLISGMPLAFVSQLAFTSLNSYTYIAIPMFILAGYLMETGGLSKRLLDFASSLVGNIFGGLGIINVVACTFFAAISGSSPGTVAAIGAMTIPEMVNKGYDRDFCASLTASSGSLGVLIPPSIPMIIYCIVGGVSIGDMFMAGFLPGLLVAFAIGLVCYIVSRKRGYRSSNAKLSGSEVWRTFKEAFWALMAPVIILGGIYSGWFTATEAAVVVVIYSMIVGLFITRELKFKDLPGIFYRTAVTAGTTVFILAFAISFSRYLTINQIPTIIGEAILKISTNKTIILLLFSAMVLFCGTFLETASLILIFTPLFLPPLVAIGVSPLQFGVVLTVGTMLGMMTPPVGINLFVAQGVSGASMSGMTKEVLPFLGSMFVAQILLVFFPTISTFLPTLLSH